MTCTLIVMFILSTLSACAATGPDSAAQLASDQLLLDDEIRALQVPAPTLGAPARFAASVARVSPAAGANATLIVKARIMPGWHIYAQVPPGQPYTQTSLKMTLPAHAKPVGEWAMPEPLASTASPDLLEYAGTAVFTHGLSLAEAHDGDEVLVSIVFQACDMMGCLPPQTVTLRVALPAE